MAKLASESLEKFLEKLASSSPVPGGGAAAALVLAQAAALAEMVARLNLKRSEKNALSQKNIAPLAGMRHKFLRLLEEDAKIFAMLSVFKKEDRTKTSYQKTLRRAASIPFKMCVFAGQGVKIAVLEKNRTSQWLYSDLLEAMILFEAGFKAARLNVEINLSSMTDKNFCVKIKRDLNRIEGTIKKGNKL